MADAYPLDESDREAVTDLLEKLDRERAEAADQRLGDTSRGR